MSPDSKRRWALCSDFSSISFVVIMLLFDHKVTKNKWKYLHLCSAISALMSSYRVRCPIGLRPPSNQIAFGVRSGCVRCPIGLRPPPDQIAFGVQSDCVRCTMKECGAEYIRSATSTVSFLSTWAAQWCPLRGTGSRRWLSRALLRGWLPRRRADSRRNRGGTSVLLRRCRRAWG